MTSSRLRELSRAASPAPWVAERMLYSLFDKGRQVPVITIGIDDAIYAVTPDVEEDDYANAKLLVALRNDAEKYADLRDAVEAYRVANLAIVRAEPAATMGFTDPMREAESARAKAVAAMLAALAALDGSAP